MTEPPAPTRTTFLSLAEIAAWWQVTTRTVRKSIASGDLKPSHREGRSLRFNIDDVRRAMRHRDDVDGA